MATDQELLYSRVSRVFETVFGDRLAFSLDVEQQQSEVWDSMSHVRLMVALEREFRARFSGREAVEMRSGRAILQRLQDVES